MGISIQGEACGEVSQHTADRLDVYSILECDGSEGVSEVVESDLRDAGPCQYSFEHIIHAVRGDRAAVGGGKHIFIVGFLFLLFQNFYRLL